ncbi:hypothetical protein G3G77_004797 [Salmonella enterica]|nr:hypothetical protein [Salmonella enterica]EEH5466556.1 hypothetical protein [Salmonella enterica]EEH7556047.1 hypothetical protein [Salmonella enterica]EEO5640255.1 hypothetical protein [Salmonella enterica]EEQ0204215.1 hypothetical protein [Salmonella enterica]
MSSGYIVLQASGQGMASGRILYTDSTHLKVNVYPERPVGVSESFAELNATVEDRQEKA